MRNEQLPPLPKMYIKMTGYRGKFEDEPFDIQMGLKFKYCNNVHEINTTT